MRTDRFEELKKFITDFYNDMAAHDSEAAERYLRCMTPLCSGAPDAEERMVEEHFATAFDLEQRSAIARLIEQNTLPNSLAEMREAVEHEIERHRQETDAKRAVRTMVRPFPSCDER
jgi:hypothetical protein